MMMFRYFYIVIGADFNFTSIVLAQKLNFPVHKTICTGKF